MAGIKVGLIGGSGLGEAMRHATDGTRHAVETPFGKPSDEIVETEWHGLPVLFLSRHGPGHLLNPSQVPYRANIYALKQLGVTHVIASGAVGSLRDEFAPRDLVVPDQLIDKTFRRPATFFEQAAVHVEFAEPFCPVLRRTLLDAARDEGEMLKVHDRGCYVCMEGPAFSTRAESLMHRLWGGDLIGMTAMPEAKLAREAEMSYALVALVTDYDCWRRPPAPATSPGASPAPGARAGGSEDVEAPAASDDPHLLLKEIVANLQAASDNGIRLIRRAVQRMAERRDELAAAPARRALELAIWSDKSRVSRDEVERLRPLWGRYFEPEPPAPSAAIAEH
jgi:5'-methylthioadenosine phosphorylase